MGVGWKAGRLAVLRRMLAAAASAADCVPVLAEMIVLAGEMSQREGGAARARPLLRQALAYLRAASGQLPPESQDYRFVLLLEAEACLLRDSDAGPVGDLDNAIECLRRLRAVLPADDPGLTEIESRLAAAVFMRTSRPGPRLADVDEAGALLTSQLDRLAPDDPGRRRATGNLALLRAIRFVAFGGSEEDRLAGVAYARECLAARADDGAPEKSADLCHFVIAWMALFRQLTSAQRSMMFRLPEVEASRRDGAAAASLLAELGGFAVSADDAEAALAHLREVSAAPADGALGGMLPMMRALALTAVGEGGSAAAIDRVAGDLRHAVDELERAASQASQDAPELLAMRAALLALHSEAAGGASPRDLATDALSDAAARLPAGHPVRSAQLSMLRAGLERQITDAETADDTASRLEQIMAALDRMPPDDPEFARAMALAAAQMLGAGLAHRSVLQDDRITPQLERAVAGLSPDDPLKVLAECNYWTSVCLQAALQQRPDMADTAIAELKRCAASAPEGHSTQTFVISAVAFALVDRHSMGGELRHLRDAETYVKQAFKSVDPAGPFAEGTPGHGGLLYLRGHLGMVWCVYDPSPHHASSAVSDLERAAEMIGDGHSLRRAVTSALEVARATRELTASSHRPDRGMFLGAASRDAFDNLLAAAESQGRDHPEYPTLLARAASGLALKGLADEDPKLIDRAISMLADACTLPGLAIRERPRLLTMHGFALLTRYIRQRSQRDLSNAIARLEEARRAAEQEIGSPYAAEVLQTLASAYRLRGDAARGDVDRAVTFGLAGLREHAGDVLLQDSDDHALYIARRGTGEATEMARWFLGQGREAAAVGALELGRGMVLHAATSGARVEEALREASHPDLADEWASEMSGGGPNPGGSADLRYQVMLAIEQSPAEARLLSPPSVGDIAAALTESGADALVYLLPRDDRATGLAVLVDPAKHVRAVPLPRLSADSGSPVRAFGQARRAAEAPGAEAGARAWEDTLGELCDWAWGAAIGPLLDAIPERGRGRDPRMVLVPGGELGLVPWHAARQPEGGYACQQAVFSYASSARQFIDATRRRPRPWGQAPVLISDSATSLRLTAAGMRHLFSEHYRTAAVFGYARDKLAHTVPGSAAATAADVFAALPSADGPGASMLHFGCHGRAEVPVLHSYLTLGAGGEVKVQEILERARYWPSRQQPGASSCGLVVLASCFSDVTDADYDEALTLAAAFLSAGAVGVVAARWGVEEAATALFMTAFHRYLNAGRLGPARALREAQLWMLDPGREVPADLPKELRQEAELSEDPDGPDLASPAAWAGFGYQGR